MPAQIIRSRGLNMERRSRYVEITAEEPEPIDGWYNYDIYIANNLQVPDDFKIKRNASAEVEVSFEVNSYGEPVNIRVEKSLCESCDREAVRLIKEGPRFKPNTGEKRTVVAVPFE